MATVEEVFAQLHGAMTGKQGEKSITVREYERLAPNRGLSKAIAYYKQAKGGMKSAQSDFSYWMWAGDRALAEVLVALFKARTDGRKNFPPLATKSLMLMDKQADLGEWAIGVLSDHKHTWSPCSHSGVGSRGSNPKCKTVCEFGGLGHEVCSKCSLERYDSSPIDRIADSPKRARKRLK